MLIKTQLKIVLSACVFLTFTVAVRGLCGPVCTDQANGALLPDPSNCTRYYSCVDDGSGITPVGPLECSVDHFFNPEEGVATCEPLTNAPDGFCAAACNPCEVVCDAPGAVQPNPEDCGSYYICTEDGGSISVTCEAPNRYFDYTVGECVETNQNCFRFCEICMPYCEYEGELVADPEDCHSYYECHPPYLEHVMCPTDPVLQIFDAYLEMCSPNAECIMEC